MMLFTFALTGLLLGFLSLYFMQSLVAQRFGHTVGWLFTVLATGLSSYGVYVGRFLRWNSWDIFTQPVSLLTDIVNSLVNPEVFIKTYTVSFSLSAIMLFAYIILYSLPHLETTVRVESNKLAKHVRHAAADKSLLCQGLHGRTNEQLRIRGVLSPTTAPFGSSFRLVWRCSH